jgi:hypothetical protein
LWVIFPIFDDAVRRFDGDIDQDIIAGTGIGGLNAILLGRLGLTVGQSIEILQRLQHEVFHDNGTGLKYTLNLLYLLLRSHWNWILSSLVVVAAVVGAYESTSVPNLVKSAQQWAILGIVIVFITVLAALVWSMLYAPPTTLLSSSELERFAKRIVKEATGNPHTMMKTDKPACNS